MQVNLGMFQSRRSPPPFLALFGWLCTYLGSSGQREKTHCAAHTVHFWPLIYPHGIDATFAILWFFFSIYLNWSSAHVCISCLNCFLVVWDNMIIGVMVGIEKKCRTDSRMLVLHKKCTCQLIAQYFLRIFFRKTLKPLQKRSICKS